MAIRLSALCTGRAVLPQNHNLSSFGSHFCFSKPQMLVRLEGLGKLKKCIRLIGSRTRNFSICSKMPQLPRVSFFRKQLRKFVKYIFAIYLYFSYIYDSPRYSVCKYLSYAPLLFPYNFNCLVSITLVTFKSIETCRRANFINQGYWKNRPSQQLFKLTVNYNTFCFATIDKVFYLVASVLTTCFDP
jgi:hypothetical protein